MPNTNPGMERFEMGSRDQEDRAKKADIEGYWRRGSIGPRACEGKREVWVQRSWPSRTSGLPAGLTQTSVLRWEQSLVGRDQSNP